MATTYYDTTSTGTWQTWVTATGSTTTTTASTDVWQTWSNATTTSTTTCSTDDTWYMWVNTTTGEVVSHTGGNVRVVQDQHRETPEQKAQREARQERWRLEREERARKEAEADARASELLLNNLTDAQRSDMKRDGFFFVNSKREGRKYRIRKGRVGNVDVIQDERIIHRLCAHPSVNCPDDDTRLAQKLMLEHMEDAFVGRANVHPARH